MEKEVKVTGNDRIERTVSKKGTTTKIISQYNIEDINFEIDGIEHSGRSLTVYIPVDEMSYEARNSLDQFINEIGLSIDNSIILRERIQETIEELIINEFWNNRLITE